MNPRDSSSLPSWRVNMMEDKCCWDFSLLLQHFCAKNKTKHDLAIPKQRSLDKGQFLRKQHTSSTFLVNTPACFTGSSKLEYVALQVFAQVTSSHNKSKIVQIESPPWPGLSPASCIHFCPKKGTELWAVNWRLQVLLETFLATSFPNTWRWLQRGQALHVLWPIYIVSLSFALETSTPQSTLVNFDSGFSLL